MMGGTISVESELGMGSKFTFTLALAIAAEGAAPKQTTLLSEIKDLDIGGLKRRALVVEDNAMSRELAVRRLRKFGFEVEVAANGEQAINLTKNSSFDIIFMDCQMPNMDGFQTTTLIRQAEFSRNTHCPIIALTAHAMEGYREQCIKAGMDDFLTKPIKEQELRDFLTRFNLEDKNETVETLAPSTPQGHDR